MKKSELLIMLFVISTLAGCKYKKEAEQLQMLNSNLTSQVAKSDSTLNEYISLINDIGNRLDSIVSVVEKPRQMAIEKDLRKRLNSAVTEINNLLKENQRKYQALRYSTNSRVSVMETKIEDLNGLVEEKDSVINSLNLKITELKSEIEEQISKISSLTNENSSKTDTLDMMIKRLNTAFYIAGTEDDLKNSNIILKTGGFLGFLGRVNTLNPQLDKSRLELIDIREKKTFSLNTDLKNLEFITKHPAGSYEIKTTDPGSVLITVTDPEKFWEGSKYLVIAI
jgi:chromosome segregation ATPase